MTTQQQIQTVAEWLKSAKYAVAFTGAGISTPSGIPDFRSADSGLWEKIDPIAVASIFGFRQNPRAFYDWVRPLTQTTIQASPNLAHLALAQLEQRGFLKSVITQNIDMLHTRAGSKTVYELHGHMREMTCIRCFTVYSAEHFLGDFLENDHIPTCTACGGVLKPNVILFGEQLPYKELQNAQADARQCDMMIVIGSSLEVEPASSLPKLAQMRGAKIVIINLQPTFFDKSADMVIHEDVAEVLPAIVAQLDLIL
jgi:NAD-dependent deacetylase